MTNPSIAKNHNTPEESTVSGYDFRIVMNGQDKLQIFDDKNAPITDIEQRMDAYQKLVSTLTASWRQDLTELNAMLTPSITTNGNTYTLGDKIEDGSYYMGISDTTNTPFCLFLETVALTKHHTSLSFLDSASFSTGTQEMRQKHKQGAEFRGHKYSKFQLDKFETDKFISCRDGYGVIRHDEIKRSYEQGTDDGGVRRLTHHEWKQVEEVFNLKPELRELALEVFKQSWVQTASLHDSGHAYYHDIKNGEHSVYGCDVYGAVVLGRSLPSPKV